MTDSGISHLPQRAAPPRPKRGAGRLFASEWGLAALALILAFLVWAIVWGNISGPTEVKVVLRPQTSARFAAFPRADGVFTLELKGPRRELEKAKARLGSPATVDMSIADLDVNEEFKTVWLRDVNQLTVPFPARLMVGIREGNVGIEVFRLKEMTVRFGRPVVEGVPDGIDYEITLEPETHPVTAPAGRIDKTIHPNHIDVSEKFADQGHGFLPGDVKETLGFDNWRNDPAERRYRTDVKLPTVQATVRFFATEKIDIRNRIVFWGSDGPLDGYEVSVSGGDAEIEQGWYWGKFQGAVDDLAQLEKMLPSWWYIVRIPRDKLPAGEDSTTETYEVEFLHTEGLDALRVQFVPKQTTLLVTIKKKAP